MFFHNLKPDIMINNLVIDFYDEYSPGYKYT